MQVKKTAVRLFILLILLMCASAQAAQQTELRGYVKGEGYQYISLGEYPYEADGSAAPVLWRILDVTDGKALLLTEYIIDTQQVIFETDQKKIDNNDYRQISAYEESDLYTWLNTENIKTLFGDDPVQNAFISEPGGGKLFILTMEQYLTTDYGFTANVWNNQPTRHATGTPYAIKTRGLYVDRATGKSPYWVADIKSKTGYRMALVGYNGHLSWGGYTRRNVGLRLAVRLDLSQLTVDGGEGTRETPFTLAFAGEASETSQTPAPPEQTASTSVDGEFLPESAGEPETTIEPESTPEPVPTDDPKPAESAQEEALLSFVGDCSIGDSAQYKDYIHSYHNTIDEKGYAWPFSLVKEYLAADDLTLANLEVVFTERRQHADKMFYLAGDPDHVNTLLEGSVEMVNTVNNHCMDFYRNGYVDLLKTLDDAGVKRFGTVYPWKDDGFDDLATTEINGIRFGFMGFSYPSESDQKRIAARVKTLKEEMGCDVVIVSLHWGREEHATPGNDQVAYAKKVIDSGADVIWGHHPHVIQPIQFYQGKPIMYSTGNFTFGTMSQVDPATGIFQLAYEKVDGEVQLKRMQVIPCQTQPGPDFRPMVLTDEQARRDVLRKLVLKKEYSKCVNPPESFLETGVIYFENNEMLP